MAKKNTTILSRFHLSSSKWENLIREPSESFIDATTPTIADRFHLGLYSEHPKSQNQDSLAFLDYSLVLVSNILIGFLVTFFILFCFQLVKSNFASVVYFPPTRSRIGRRAVRFREYLPKVLTRISRTLNFFWFHSRSSRLLTRVNLIFLFFLLFLNLNLSMLMMSIKTNEVVLDTR